MATIRKIKAGYKAKANGQIFEAFVKSCAQKQGFKVTQIPLGAKQIGGGKLIRVRTDFDFILWKNGFAVALDAKSTTHENFATDSLTSHQVLSLKEIEDQGFIAGYLVYFSELERVVFYSATQLSQMRFRQSLKPENGIQCGRINKMDFSPILALAHPLLSQETNLE